MKHFGRKLTALLSKVLVILLVVLLFPYGQYAFRALFPDLTGEIRMQSTVLELKLHSSSRLEVTTVEEEGVFVSDTSVIILGTVGKTTIRYRYTASLGIDLKKVQLKAEQDRIILMIPEPEVLNDGIEALQIDRRNAFSFTIDPKMETLLSKQRQQCREKYLSEAAYSDRIWQDTVQALEKTFCDWLDDFGERHYPFEFRKLNEPAAETDGQQVSFLYSGTMS